jgi:hypothetical protein
VGCGNDFVGADVEGSTAAPLDVTVAADPTPSGCPSIVLAATAAAAAGANLLFETVANCSNFVSERLLLAGGRGVAGALLVVMSAILCGGWSRGIAKLLLPPLVSGFLSGLELVPAMLPKTCTSRSCSFCESEDRAGADEGLLAIAAGTWELDASNDPFSKPVKKTS